MRDVSQKRDIVTPKILDIQEARFHKTGLEMRKSQNNCD